jgi:hypothetical protein
MSSSTVLSIHFRLKTQMHMQQEQPTAPSSTATAEHHHNNNNLIIHGSTNQTLLNPKALSIQSDTAQNLLTNCSSTEF